VKSQRAYVAHVLECIGRIKADSASGRDAVFSSHTLQDAIIRNLQVLCESVRRVDPASKELRPEIDWKAIAGMRNVLVHDYFDVDFEALWDVIVRDPATRIGHALHDCADRCVAGLGSIRE
jgi:uncharacterized protein with HEPN domain